jgi:hypothetical protein
LSGVFDLAYGKVRHMKDVFLARLYRTRRYFIGSAFIAIAVIGFSLVLPSQKTNAVAVRGNTHTNEYMQANWNAQIARGIPYPVRTEPMVLRGSWDEMGRQYGKSSGKYIRIVYDAFYGLWLNSRLDPNKLGAVLDRYQGEAKTLSPEMVEFAQGISEGAAIELDDADHAPALTNMQKIMLINCPFEVVFPTAWPHVAEMMGMSQPSQTNVAQWEPFASHTWAAWGNMTPGGGTIMGGTRDQPWFPTLYNVSYVAIPSDKKAAVTWGNAIAGLVASSAQVNEHGVGLGNTRIFLPLPIFRFLLIMPKRRSIYLRKVLLIIGKQPVVQRSLPLRGFSRRSQIPGKGLWLNVPDVIMLYARPGINMNQATMSY